MTDTDEGKHMAEPDTAAIRASMDRNQYAEPEDVRALCDAYDRAREERDAMKIAMEGAQNAARGWQERAERDGEPTGSAWVGIPQRTTASTSTNPPAQQPDLLRCDRNPDETLHCEFAAGHSGMHQADGHWWGGAQRAIETGDLRPLIEGEPAQQPAGPDVDSYCECTWRELVAALKARDAEIRELQAEMEEGAAEYIRDMGHATRCYDAMKAQRDDARARLAEIRALLQPIGCDPDCESGPDCDGWDHVVSFKIRDCIRKAYAALGGEA